MLPRMEPVRYSSATSEDVEAVRRFVLECRGGGRAEDAERFRLMVERADRTVIAREGDRVVGFARALCDGVSNGYVSMVTVARDRRRQGIGREMLRRLMGDDPRITWVLRASAESVPFWRRLGFVASTCAMERPRER